MKSKELFKRYILLIVGLFFSAFGVALTKYAELGVSPISSVANIASLKFTALSLGNWLIIWNCLLIIGQAVILRKDFKIIQLLQIPVSFLFGYFTDLGMKCVSYLPLSNYFSRLCFIIAGVIVLAFGISLSVIADVIMNSGEAFVKAVSDKCKKPFGNMKITFDVCCVILSVILSLIFFHGKIEGTREGTIISALLTGAVVKFFSSVLSKPLNKFIKK